MKTASLICTNCKKTFSGDAPVFRCDICGEPLEVETVTSGGIKEGGRLTQTILERYSDFFPFQNIFHHISLGEGFTSLIDATELAEELHVRRILLKNESQNPTWSFKDRGTVTGVRHALQCGVRVIGTVSTGNMAVSVAAYGAKADLATIIIVSSHIPPEKIKPIAIHDPILLRVEGGYGSLYYRSLEVGQKEGIYFINSDSPFRVEGSKTIAFEICEQMHFSPPDYVVVPTSSGGNARGIMKGFEEFKRCGLIREIPRMICVQAAGCAPIYNAFIRGEETVAPVAHPETIAGAIANPAPPSGNEVLRKIRQKGGRIVAVDDSEILCAQRRLADKGIFAQPASAASLAAVMKLREKEILTKDDVIACIITGAGLKYQAALERHEARVVDCSAKNLEEIIIKSVR